MSAIFAIQVMTGKELQAKAEILRQVKELGITVIKDVIAFEVFTKKFCGKEFAPSKARSIVPGYIFVNMEFPGLENRTLYDMKKHAGTIWHFIKRIPFVQRILPYSIQDEEFENFFEIVSEHTDDFEVSVIEESVTPDKKTEHAAKTIRSKKDKDSWLHTLQNPPLLERLKRVKFQAVDLLNRYTGAGSKQLGKADKAFLTSIKHSEGWLKRGTPTFRISGRLFIETRNIIDPDQKLSNSLLTTGSFIVPHIVSYVEEKMRSMLSRSLAKQGKGGYLWTS